MRLLGGLLLLLATSGALRPAGLRRGGVYVTRLVLVDIFCYIAPGACFVFLSIFAARARRWAIIASICLTAVASLGILMLLARMLHAVIARNAPGSLWISIGFIALFEVAMAQLIFHLARSFEATRYVAPGERGFDLIMATPVVAAPTAPPTRLTEHVHEPPAI
jgi:hypothetical protein